ncbi:MAG: cyclophilin-like fold protein [Candidatus Hinthialibacter antarcticus]|nr:cyclophilin-like fold protein [Candidatus Hinthialibacter antarcticus]
MTHRVQITLGELQFTALFEENDAANAIYDVLPFDLPYQTWGDEIYCHIPVELKARGGVEIVKVGDLAFWPPGKAFCIFFGPTPASEDERPRAASEVIVFGRIEGDASALRGVKANTIRVEPMPDE